MWHKKICALGLVQNKAISSADKACEKHWKQEIINCQNFG